MTTNIYIDTRGNDDLFNRIFDVAKALGYTSSITGTGVLFPTNKGALAFFPEGNAAGRLIDTSTIDYWLKVCCDRVNLVYPKQFLTALVNYANLTRGTVVQLNEGYQAKVTPGAATFHVTELGEIPLTVIDELEKAAKKLWPDGALAAPTGQEMTAIYIDTRGQDNLYQWVLDVARAQGHGVVANSENNGGAIAFRAIYQSTVIDTSKHVYWSDEERSGGKLVTVQEFLQRLHTVPPYRGIDVKINNGYTAALTAHNKTFKVGCQSFDREVIQKLVAAKAATQSTT